MRLGSPKGNESFWGWTRLGIQQKRIGLQVTWVPSMKPLRWWSIHSGTLSGFIYSLVGFWRYRGWILVSSMEENNCQMRDKTCSATTFDQCWRVYAPWFGLKSNVKSLWLGVHGQIMLLNLGRRRILWWRYLQSDSRRRCLYWRGSCPIALWITTTMIEWSLASME